MTVSPTARYGRDEEGKPYCASTFTPTGKVLTAATPIEIPAAAVS